MSLQEGRNINFMNTPSVYTLIMRIKCYLGWVRLFAASEVVLLWSLPGQGLGRTESVRALTPAGPLGEPL